MQTESLIDAVLVAGLICLTMAAAGDGSRAQTSVRPSDPKPASGLVERGRYLVHDVAMCVQCHSPRDENGELIESALLTGAPVPIKSPFPNQEWASRTPSLRGLNFLSEPEAMRLLREGIARTGNPPQSPMPRFHMTREDAAAIVAYLNSLK